MAEIISINISSEKGIEKNSVKEANLIENWGFEGDAHAGDWDRQVSIFPVEALDKVPANKMDEVLNGGYTENITVRGLSLAELSVGAVVRIGDAEIKILHIGKEEFKENGRPYIVSREGRFGKVIKGGKIKISDEIFVIS